MPMTPSPATVCISLKRFGVVTLIQSSNGDALRICILEGPYTPTTVIIPDVPATDNTLAEAIHLLLTGIGDKIYSTVDACKTAHEMWEAIERLQQDPYYQAPKSHKSYAPTSKASPPTISHATTRHKGKEIAKPITPPSKSASEEDSDPEQAQKDKTWHSLQMTVVGARETIGSQVVQQIRIQCFNCKEFGHFAKECRKPKRVKDSTYHKEKMLLCKQAKKGVPLQAEQSDWLIDTDEEIDEQELEAHYSFMARYKRFLQQTQELILRHWNRIVNPDSPDMCDNDIQTDQNAVECDDERVALANLIANLKLDVDENKKIQKQLKKANTSLAHELTECKSILAETSRTLGESSIRDNCLIALQNKQTELETCKTLNDRIVDYDKLEHKLNKTLGLLAQKEIDIKEGLKLKAYEILVVKEKHDELVKQILLTKSTLYDSVTVQRRKKRELADQAWEKHSHDHFHAPTAHDMEILIKTYLMPLAIKTQNDSFTFVHELKQEMHDDLMYVESFEKEIDKHESDKAEFSNMDDILLQECVSNDVICSYLHSLFDLDVHTKLQCLFLHKVKECECLAQKLSKQTKTVSKEVYTELLRSFAKLEKHSISLELALQQCQEQMKNDTVCKEKALIVFQKEREQYFKIQDLKAQMQDKNIAICELKELNEKCKGKYVETKFDKPFQRIPKPSVLGKPTPFSDSLERKKFSKTKSVLKTNVSEGLSKPVTTQILPHTARKAVTKTNVIKLAMYRIDTRTTQTRAPQLPQTYKNTNPRMSTSTRVTHRTNVSRSQLRSTQMKDKVVPNTSQVKFKKTKVEDHHRISSISNKTKSVTACNDSLKSRTSNVNVVCATCGKCVFNSIHDACVSKFLNDVNAKKPKVVPISTRQPKSQANKSVATPPKKTVASESTIQNSKSYYRMLYEKTSKA
ncbi:retrovirus-related pol polyprotein from transposon TNT 1-94 [Tanacetum coccineum]|uniref:Retrovirus-related pol polyprotein from transposon TNT 1-94 n=1 Tax=Tanacetum coccineum TaxID=301880 RepID=A0ABQ5C523_9ASTR